MTVFPLYFLGKMSSKYSKRRRRTPLSKIFTKSVAAGALTLVPLVFIIVVLVMLVLQFTIFKDSQNTYHFVFIPVWVLCFVLAVATLGLTVAFCRFRNTNYTLLTADYDEFSQEPETARKIHTQLKIMLIVCIITLFYVLSSSVLLYLNLAVLPYLETETEGGRIHALNWFIVFMPSVLLSGVLSILFAVLAAFETRSNALRSYMPERKLTASLYILISNVLGFIGVFFILLSVQRNYPKLVHVAVIFIPLYLAEIAIIMYLILAMRKQIILGMAMRNVAITVVIVFLVASTHILMSLHYYVGWAISYGLLMIPSFMIWVMATVLIASVI